MIKIFLTTILFTTQALAGLPPTTIKGQADTGKPTTFNFEVPNSQATVTSPTTALIETGNGNLLKNASFEAPQPTVSTVSGWTLGSFSGTPFTSTAATTNVTDGNKSARITMATGNSSNTIIEQTVTSTRNYKNKNMEVSVMLTPVSLTDFTNAYVRLCIQYGSTNSCPPDNIPWSSLTIGVPSKLIVNFPGMDGSVGNQDYKIYIGGGGTIGAAPTMVFDIDEAYLGPATNIGTYTPPTLFSAFVSSGGVLTDTSSIPGIFWGSIALTDTSLYTINFVGLTSGANCSATPVTSNVTLGAEARIEAQSSAYIAIRTGTTSTSSSFTKAPLTFTLNCAKPPGDTPQTVVRQDLPILPKTIIFNSNGTYTPTPGTSHIIVRMVGGGGGGAGSGLNTTAGVGGTGGNTSFGSSLLVANGGAGGAQYTSGTQTVGYTANSPASVKSIYVGNAGSGGACMATTSTFCTGGAGGASPLFGGGPGTAYNASGVAGATNSGAGGSGAGANNIASLSSGSGGSAGLGLEAQINFPSGSYTVTIGNGGSGGTAGTSGLAGSPGGSGRIEITEYYQLGSAVILPGMEPIGASYHTPTNPTVPNVTSHTILFGTKIFDYTNSYNPATGEFIVPKNGMYQAVCDTGIVFSSWTIGNDFTAEISVGGVSVSQRRGTIQNSGTFTGDVPSVIYNGPLTAGTSVKCRIYQNSGSNKTLGTGSTFKFTVIRTGMIQ